MKSGEFEMPMIWGPQMKKKERNAGIFRVLPLKTGLLIFRSVAEPRNSGKLAKSRKIHKNRLNKAKFGRSLIKYMSVQQF